MRTSPLDPFAGLIPFVTTAEALSFRDAAQQLGVTSSAVSKAVSKLEADVGVRLLHRTSRCVSLTTDGEIFLARCRDALDRARSARELLMDTRRVPRGLLRVSMPLPFGRLVVPALPAFLERYPTLSVQIVLTDRFVRLTEEKVDVVVRVGEVEESRAVARPLRNVRWTAVASPAYLARRGIPETPEQLAGHNCLKFVRPKGLTQPWVFLDAAGTPRPIAVEGSVCADNGDALVGAAVAGVGIVLAHDFMVKREIATGELVEVLRARTAPGPAITALSAPGRNTAPKVRAFTELVRGLLSP
jgi:LysR family transcriptional regulator, regulator for bpeEF and oprC